VSATGTAIAEARGRVPGKEQRRAPRPAPSGPPPAVPVPLPPGQQERPDPVTWPETEASAEQVLARVPALEAGRAAGTLKLSLISVRHTLQWLAGYPGETWQARWRASGADQAGRGWRALAGDADPVRIRDGVHLLLIGQVIRPSLQWLLAQYFCRTLTRTLDVIDPDGAAALEREYARRQAGGNFGASRNVIARIVLAKGGPISAITAGDSAWYWHTRRAATESQVALDAGLSYSLLYEMGVFGKDAPPTLTGATRPGQKTCAELVDQWGIECQPIRDLLVDYLGVRRPAMDYSSLVALTRHLGLLFWRDLELNHPGINSLNLADDVATGWKLRLQTVIHDPRRAGQRRLVPESTMTCVRSFYADLAWWAAEDPARWGRFAAPCPIRASEVTFTKRRRLRKAAIDQRTRTLAPVLPVLVRVVQEGYEQATGRLRAAELVGDGCEFTFAGVRYVRRDSLSGRSIRAIECGTGRQLDLQVEEERAFWTRAIVGVLRQTGVRIEELLELTHHSFCAYTLPGTGEVVPMLQIAPSKTDSERLILVSPELGEVLADVITRVRAGKPAVPLASRWDPFERRWSPPMPFLFQRPEGGVQKMLTHRYAHEALTRVMKATGVTTPDGSPLPIGPHDFRRIFATDALRSGLPPHIAAKILGHQNLNTTMGYAAVYPEDVITAHRAFIARRRSLRPSAEYRELTPGEWEEFIGHFELRKVELGVCTRDFGTPCVHEHVPLTELTGARVGPAAPVGADRRQPPRPDSRGTRQRLERRSRRPGGQRRRSRAEAAADRRTDRPAHRDLPRYA